MSEEGANKTCNGCCDEFCRKYCDNRKSHNVEQLHLMLTVIILLIGLILIIVSVTEYSAAVAIVALIPCFIAIAPCYFCGPPPPFIKNGNFFFQRNAIFTAINEDNGTYVCLPNGTYVCLPFCLDNTRMRSGRFISGACAFSAPSIIIVLWTVGNLSWIPSILAIVGLIIVFLSVIFYLWCFHTRQNICMCIDADDSGDEEEEFL